MSYVSPNVQTAVIANGGTTSQALAMAYGTIIGIIMPGTITGTALSFTACDTKDGTFVPIYDTEGNQVTVTVAASRGYGLSGSDADALCAFPFIKLVMDAQGAERSITVITR